MLFLAAALCTAIGAFVVWSGEEREVKAWFSILCVSCAAICLGLWVETHLRDWAFVAARNNMTAALVAIAAALASVRVMCRLKLDRRVVMLLLAATAAHLLTVWATPLYFTGAIIEYRWGTYVAGNPEFVITPLLSTAIALYCLWVILTNFSEASALDRNRMKYLFLSYMILAACLLDYLPHFGIDLFGGSVSAIGMPLFVGLYGYACLRYRLIAFRELLGRTTAWAMTALCVGGVYLLALEAAERFMAVQRSWAHAAAGLLAMATFAMAWRRLPRWVRRLLDAPEPDLGTVEHFSAELITVLDERALEERMRKIGTEEFGAVEVEFLDGDALEAGGLRRLVAEETVVESEVARRGGRVESPLFGRWELLVSTGAGALAFGRRYDSAMYSARAISSLRVLANIFGLAHENARRVRVIRPRR